MKAGTSASASASPSSVGTDRGFQRSSDQMNAIAHRITLLALVVMATAAWVHPAFARSREDEPECKDLQGVEQQFRVGPNAPKDGSTGAQGTLAIPDIFGPGAVLTVGNVFMKCTNYGLDGNPFT